MSASFTSWPAIETSNESVCEAGCPPERLTKTEWIVSPAICSAAWTEAMIESSAASTSTISPARTPSDPWWPMPTTRRFPSSSARAMKQLSFVEPTSSAAINSSFPFTNAMI